MTLTRLTGRLRLDPAEARVLTSSLVTAMEHLDEDARETAERLAQRLERLLGRIDKATTGEAQNVPQEAMP